MLKAIEHSWEVVRFAAPELMADSEVVGAALAGSWEAFEFASDELRSGLERRRGGAQG